MSKFPIDILKGADTPLYYYDLDLLRQTLAALNEAAATHPGYTVHYAMKANANPAVLEDIRKAGLGIDAQNDEVNISKGLDSTEKL